MLFSISFVYSASASIAEFKFGTAEELFYKHASRVLVGIVIIFVFAKVDYHFWEKISKPLLFLGILFTRICAFRRQFHERSSKMDKFRSI